ncbi:hypothetical protein GEO21_04290 [Sphingobacterium faecium]|uniref:WxcM-like domain-containing protein n=1 Tax=Sphingobacterium faecium TaxID=34087 RepID=UPI001291555C|nr:WxcM-like domain-containing protein [Sphingobacterium faecium]MQP26738.1 hypothetical protein [Sphingobacterium faecium]
MLSNNRTIIQSIKGGVAQDQRGQIRFVNDFDMSLVKRFYIIKNADVELVRGWRAHRIEQRWFYVLAGAFELDLIQIDNWEKAAVDLDVQKIKIDASEMQVLHVPHGYGTAFRALQPDSELLVFADHGIEHAAKDDYTWPLEYFVKRS